MQYLVTRNIIQVVGKIWMPQITAAMEYTLSDSDLERHGIDKENPTKRSIERWVIMNAGDFSHIEDFRADIGENKIVDWSKSESETTFNDCMFPVEDQDYDIQNEKKEILKPTRNMLIEV